ncbi:T9SS type A sorting domain-containing protein [Membranihabitans maritimus]|uniref:T9SS type A sorting domain-containing protein n=1 Tax=Membranihabitans maritimus TaxID=2904244 RepID=UPI001F3D8D3B|nr:T9SS type A sorting domain-containing protein [Membranihabitans maritimus]
MKVIGINRLIFIPVLIIGLSSIVHAHCRLTTYLSGENLQSGKHLNIKWEIEIEHNQEGWDLFYSTDNGHNWEPIKTGMPVDQLSYDWSIPYVNTHDALIRIVQVNSGGDYEDISGKFSISTGVMTASSQRQRAKVFEFSVAPNIVHSDTRITFHPDTRDYYRISVHSLAGKEISLLANRTFPPGDQSIILHADNLPPGLYFIIIKNSKGLGIKKFIII